MAVWGRRSVLGGAAALAGAGAGVLRPARAEVPVMEWAAGSLGGGWYTMAAGLTALVTEENPDLRFRVVPGGGLANCTRVNNGQSNMGWGIDAFTANAGKGEEPYREKHTRLRTLGTGYSPTELNFLRHADSGPTDLRAILTQKNLRLGTPQRSSTDEMTMQRILRFFGSSPEKIRSEGGRYLNGSYSDIADAYGDGQVDYLFVCLAKPAAMLTELSQGRRAAKLVAFPDELRKHMQDNYEYGQGEIPAGTYPKLQDGAVPVNVMDSVVLVQDTMPDDVAYRMTRTFIRNKGPRLVAIHASMASYDPAVACRYNGVPLHPGAARAYREAGFDPV